MANFHSSACARQTAQLKVTKILILSLRRRYKKQKAEWKIGGIETGKDGKWSIINFACDLVRFLRLLFSWRTFFSARSIEPHCPNRRARRRQCVRIYFHIVSTFFAFPPPSSVHVLARSSLNFKLTSFSNLFCCRLSYTREMPRQSSGVEKSSRRANVARLCWSALRDPLCRRC